MAVHDRNIIPLQNFEYILLCQHAMDYKYTDQISYIYPISYAPLGPVSFNFKEQKGTSFFSLQNVSRKQQILGK